MEAERPSKMSENIDSIKWRLIWEDRNLQYCDWGIGVWFTSEKDIFLFITASWPPLLLPTKPIS
jgi:hypothetical protein